MINRRNFLKSSSAFIALPLLASDSLKSQKFKRLVCMSNPFGMIPSGFYPENPGSISKLPETLTPLNPFKDKISILKNLDHNLSGGHDASEAVFSGILRKEAKGSVDGNISIDQKAALHFAHLTRLPYINIQLGRSNGFGDISYWTKEGIPVPAYRSAEELFAKLFLREKEAELKKKDLSLNTKRSILDTVLSDIHSLENRLSRNDKTKLAEYSHSIRTVEKKLQMEQYWLKKEKAQTDYKLPRRETEFTEAANSLIDLAGLAFETDSTRIVTIGVSGRSGGRDTGLHSIYHHASHHGNEEENLKQLLTFEKVQMTLLSRLVQKLHSTEDRQNGGTLLDNTLIVFACGMANPSSHDNRNLPVMLIGGGLQHKGLINCPDKQKVPMSNLLLSILHYLGIHEEKFARSKGTFSPFKIV